MFSAGQHKIGCHLLAHGPSHHLAAECVDDHRQVDEARPRRQVRHVGHPQLVRRVGAEVAVHQIGRWTLARVALGRDREAAPPADPTDTRIAHQARHALAAGMLAVHAQPRPHAGHPVRFVGCLVDLANPLGEHGAADRSRARRTVAPLVVAAGRDAQHPAGSSHAQAALGAAWIALTSSKTVWTSCRASRRTRPQSLPGCRAPAPLGAACDASAPSPRVRPSPGLPCRARACRCHTHSATPSC